MLAFVTGAAGFIGSTLVDHLLADGHQVVGIDNLTTGSLENLADARRANRLHPNQFAFAKIDVQSPELTETIVGAEPDVIFHLAAQVDLRASVSDPLFDARSNVLGTINICEAARRAGVQRVVYAASGGSRYGAPAMLPVGEETAVGPLSPYAVAKLAGELYLGAYAGMYSLTPICLALSNVYGPRQNPRGEAGVIAMFGSAMICGRPVTVFGDGSASRDYVYVDDVVDAFIRAGVAPPCVTGTFNIGTGKQATVLEVHRLIADVLGDSSVPRFAAARTGELQAIALDAAKAEEQLGWVPAVALGDGIERTIQWLVSTLIPGAGADC